MKKIMIALFVSAGMAYADNCDWAVKEVGILTQELQHNINYGTKKQKQDTFNNLADVVEYELIPDCKGKLPNSTLRDLVYSLQAIKARAKREGWWYK